MIKYGALLPTYHVQEFSELMDFDFLEPIPDQEYKDFYHHKAPTSMRLLDNGLIEFGDSIVKGLIPYAKHVNATHIIPPDKLGEWQYNMEMAKYFAQSWPKEQMYIALGGPSPEDFYLQSDWCWQEDYGGVCLPYRLNRVPVAHPNVHLLGLRVPERWREFDHGADSKASLDTTEPINAAIYHHTYRVWNGVITLKRHPYYQSHKFTNIELYNAMDNIRFFKEKLNER